MILAHAPGHAASLGALARRRCCTHPTPQYAAAGGDTGLKRSGGRCEAWARGISDRERTPPCFAITHRRVRANGRVTGNGP
jgi:hypothetical protein